MSYFNQLSNEASSTHDDWNLNDSGKNRYDSNTNISSNASGIGSTQGSANAGSSNKSSNMNMNLGNMNATTGSINSMNANNLNMNNMGMNNMGMNNMGMNNMGMNNMGMNNMNMNNMNMNNMNMNNMSMNNMSTNITNMNMANSNNTNNSNNNANNTSLFGGGMNSLMGAAALNMLGAMSSHNASNTVGAQNGKTQGGMVPNSVIQQVPILNNPIAQLALNTGQSFIASNAPGWFSWLSISPLRPYFRVDNMYVLRKVRLVLCPLLELYKPWDRIDLVTKAFRGEDLSPIDQYAVQMHVQRHQLLLQQQQQQSGTMASMVGMNPRSIMASIPPLYAPPTHDVHAVDLYVPVMAFISYVLLCGYVSGISNAFTPENISKISFHATGAIAFEAIAVYLGCFLFRLSSPKPLDLVSIAGYKYVSFVASILCGLVFGHQAFLYAIFGSTLMYVIFYVKMLNAILQKKGEGEMRDLSAVDTSTSDTSLTTVGGKLSALKNSLKESMTNISATQFFILGLGGTQFLLAALLLRSAAPPTSIWYSVLHKNTESSRVKDGYGNASYVNSDNTNMADVPNGTQKPSQPEFVVPSSTSANAYDDGSEHY